MNDLSPKHYIDGILGGDMAILSRAITLVESQNQNHQRLAQAILDGVIPKAGGSFRLGVTGVPGVGKSSFIEKFGLNLLDHGLKLAVLAIDPSSTLSKGSILGDKTRMEQLSAHEDVYIRPSPSSGNLGGVRRTTYETILLCEAAGFDFVIVETVGVGQSEISVARLTDFFLLLMLAGAGDELQGIKRGIMEMADAVVITKADGANLDKARAARGEYARAMHLLQPSTSGWTPRTLVCSAMENTGMHEIYQMIGEYRTLAQQEYLTTKRRAQQMAILKEILDEEILRKFYREKNLAPQLETVSRKDLINPYGEAVRMIND